VVEFGGVVYAMLPLTRTRTRTHAQEEGQGEEGEAEVLLHDDDDDDDQTYHENMSMCAVVSGEVIASMEGELRRIYCPTELAELEITLLSQLLRHDIKLDNNANSNNANNNNGNGTGINDINGNHAGADADSDSHGSRGSGSGRSGRSDIGGSSSSSSSSSHGGGGGSIVLVLDGVVDMLVWQLVSSVLVHRRQNYARRVAGLGLLVKTALYKTFAAQGYHLSESI
jgi:uncharacterized membrane protein YgcG